MAIGQLPRLDEHSVGIAASAEHVWDATLASLDATFADRGAATFARLLGCEPVTRAGWDAPTVGSSLPGFSVVTADRPQLLVVSGRHRFARYGITFRIGAAPAGTRLAAESRAGFAGALGALYGLAVVGSAGHAIAVHRLLRSVRQLAEQQGAGG